MTLPFPIFWKAGKQPFDPDTFFDLFAPQSSLRFVSQFKDLLASRRVGAAVQCLACYAIGRDLIAERQPAISVVDDDALGDVISLLAMFAAAFLGIEIILALPGILAIALTDVLVSSLRLGNGIMSHGVGGTLSGGILGGLAGLGTGSAFVWTLHNWTRYVWSTHRPLIFTGAIATACAGAFAGSCGNALFAAFATAGVVPIAMLAVSAGLGASANAYRGRTMAFDFAVGLGLVFFLWFPLTTGLALHYSLRWLTPAEVFAICTVLVVVIKYLWRRGRVLEELARNPLHGVLP